MSTLRVPVVVGVTLMAVMGSGLPTSAQPTPEAPRASISAKQKVKKKVKKGALEITVSGTGSYTITGKGLRKAGSASQRYKVPAGRYTVTAPGAQVTPSSVTVRPGKTKQVKVSFPAPAAPVVPVAPPAVTTPVPPPPAPVAPPPPAPDVIAPGPVTALSVTGRTTSSIALAWTNPTDPDLADVVVRRALGATPPSTITSGTPVTLASPRASTVTDAGLSAGTAYSYGVFTRDTAGNVSSPATVNSRTRDVTPPQPVQNLEVTQRIRASITLSWTNPSDPDLAGIVVRRAPGATPPASATDGTEVTLSSATATSVTDNGLAASTAYAYSVFAQDTSGNTSSAATTTAMTTSGPSDVTWAAEHQLTSSAFSNDADVVTDISDDGNTAFAVWQNPDSWRPEAGTHVSWWRGGTWGASTKLPCTASLGAESNPAAMNPAGDRALVVDVMKACVWDGTTWTASNSAYDPGTGFHTEYYGTSISADTTKAVVVWTVIPHVAGEKNRVEAAFWNAGTWSSPVVLDTDVRHFSFPRVSLSEDGSTAVAVWGGSGNLIRTARYSGGSWSAATTLLNNGDYPNVAVSADGSKVVAGADDSFRWWSEGAWSAPQAVGIDQYLLMLQDLRITADGTHAEALWWKGSGPAWTATSDGNVWSAPTPAYTGQGYYALSNLGWDATGQKAVLAWFQGSSIVGASRTADSWSDLLTMGTGDSGGLVFGSSLWLASTPDGSRTVAGWVRADGYSRYPMVVVGQRSP